MANINYDLMIKYGLEGLPVDYKVREWAMEADRLISLGDNKEQAGEKAARVVFPDTHRKAYAAAADDIDTLLELARKK